MKKRIAVITTAFGNGLEDRRKTWAPLAGSLDLDVWYCAKDDLLRDPKGVEGVIVGVEKADRALFSCPDLRIAMKFGVGLDAFDLDAAKEMGIAVVNFPGINSEAVAELVISFVLSLSRRIHEMGCCMAEGRFKQICSHSVAGKTLGIVGMGSIGRHVASFARGLRMRCLGTDVRDFDCEGVQKASFDEVLRNSDAVSVHVPLSASTRHMIGARQMASMRRGAILINAARGGIVDDNALLESLESGHLGGAGLDVFESEETMRALARLPNAICTPHVAAYTHETLRRMEETALRKMHECLFGNK